MSESHSPPPESSDAAPLPLAPVEGPHRPPGPEDGEGTIIVTATGAQSILGAGSSRKLIRELPELPNDQLGEFHLLRRLGQGGMAEVYLAEQTSLHRKVALKVLRKELLSGSNDLLLRRFEQEAKAAGGLNHPNIVQVYMIGEEQGIHFIAQEYVRGLNLREYLNKKGPPDVNAALHIMKQVGTALQAAADAGIVHRDIKPENILITRKGEVKVADFGLAQLSQSGERLNLTQVGMTMGTPLYMSPEQVSGQPVDQRSDLYSFGVTCYHMLSGQPPFRGETAIAIAVKHIHEVAEPLSKRRPDLPPALCRIVHLLMSKKPEERYPDARSVVADVRKLQSALKEGPDAQPQELSVDSFAPESLTGQPLSPTLRERILQLTPLQKVFGWLTTCAAVGLAAAAVGMLTRPLDPLSLRPQGASPIPRQSSIAKQFAIAPYLDEEEAAWKAVINYSEQESQYKRQAQEQLALLYLREGRYEDAAALFDEFKRLGEMRRDYVARGIAGTAIVAALQGDKEQARQILRDELPPYRQLLRDDDDLDSLLAETERKLRNGRAAP